MLRVTLLVPHAADLAPSQRFRFEQWLRLLPEGSVHADVRPLFSAAAYDQLYEPGHFLRKAGQTTAALVRRVRDVLAPGRPDVVVLARSAFPFGPPVLEWLVERRFPVVFDFDDAVYLRSTSEANRSVAFLKAPSATKHVIARATITTVGNEHLAAYARRYSAAVRVLPTTLDVDEYRPREPRPVRSPVRIGWSGSRTTVPHLATIAPALRRLLSELPAELVVVGADRFHLEGSENVVVQPWNRATEQDDVRSFDIGIMPLTDDEWGRGKCGFKALLYMALGVPAVVSPVGVNREIVQDGVNGLLASTEDEWVDAVSRVATDAELRRRLGLEGRRTVVERFSGQRWAPRFLDVLHEAAAAGSPRRSLHP